MSEYESVIVCGDFNFCSTQASEQNALKQMAGDYLDVWEQVLQSSYNQQLQPSELGATSGVNFKTPRSKPSRYDRILVKSKILHATSIVQTGNTPIGEQLGKPIFISDHLGLVATFSFQKLIGSKEEM